MTVTYGPVWCTFCSNFSGVTASKFRSSDDNERLDSSSIIGVALNFVIYYTKIGLLTMASTRHFTGRANAITLYLYPAILPYQYNL